MIRTSLLGVRASCAPVFTNFMYTYAMSERFRPRPQPEIPRNIEQVSDIEVQESLDELDKLLAILIESGMDLSDQKRHDLRAQVQQTLSALGLRSLEDQEGLLAIYERLNRAMTDLPTPEGYPGKKVFDERVARLSQNVGEAPYAVPQKPSATEVAQYAQGDWERLEGRGGKDIADYLYQLGKILSSNFAYAATFDETDAIEIGDDWKVENGRHRAMALRALGHEYIDEHSMDRWVSIRREE